MAAAHDAKAANLRLTEHLMLSYRPNASNRCRFLFLKSRGKLHYARNSLRTACAYFLLGAHTSRVLTDDNATHCEVKAASGGLWRVPFEYDAEGVKEMICRNKNRSNLAKGNIARLKMSYAKEILWIFYIIFARW